MKRILIILICLLLSIPLHGCGNTEAAQPNLDTEFPVPPLDELKSMLYIDTLLSAEDVTPPDMLEQTGMRLLQCTQEEATPNAYGFITMEQVPVFNALLGPSGCVPVWNMFGFGVGDPLFADLNGDGIAEFVYDLPGPTSGLFTWEINAYGLEDGIPVLKANTILNLNWSDNIHLEQSGNGIAFVYAGEGYPLAIEENRIVFPEGLPAHVSDWGGAEWGLVGASLKRIREQFAEWIVYDTNCCVIWRIPRGGAEGSPEVFAALSKNWKTVSGLISFRVGANGKLGGLRLYDTPLIETPTDPDSLIGLTVEELEERLGPWHFDSGSGLYLLGWFTEDGLLLQVIAGTTVSSAKLYDPLKDEWLANADSD